MPRRKPTDKPVASPQPLDPWRSERKLSPEVTQRYLDELKRLLRPIVASDADGLGIGRRLRGCRCDKCLAHFGLTAEEFDRQRREPAWITEDP